ncbi:defensin-like protein 69, partial [Eutrema salsugineum]|uniref:defensin-like protein 69 n=1 Tax=Eutrema salsugineum TaxID=72664 RepID=UPI000CED11F6
LLVAFSLVVTMSISYDLYSGIGINARTVPPTCYEECNVTFQNNECNKMCVGLAYKNGSCIDPEGVKQPKFYRCCCNPIILSPPSF